MKHKIKLKVEHIYISNVKRKKAEKLFSSLPGCHINSNDCHQIYMTLKSLLCAEKRRKRIESQHRADAWQHEATPQLNSSDRIKNAHKDLPKD